MEQTTIIDDIVSFLRSGFGEVNQVQGLLIALAATVFMGSWKQWLPIGLLAAVVHIAVDTLAPVLANGAAFRLPDIMSEEFWRWAAILFVGYLIVIAVFFFIKRLLLRSGSAAKAH